MAMIEIDNMIFEKTSQLTPTELFPIKEFNDISDLDAHGLFCARFRGSVLGLFGLPLLDRKDLDEGAYEYIVKCVNIVTGDIKHFLIVELRLGPVLYAADNDDTSKHAGELLWQRILETNSPDYNAMYFDDENSLKVYYGSRNSEPYFDLKGFNLFDYVIRYSRLLISLVRYR
jgi:hypothetical protein